MGNDLVEHIAESHFIGGGNGVGLADSQILKVIHLIDRKHHRLTGMPQHIRHSGIVVHKPLLYVHHENNHIRRVYGNLRLLAHLG